MAGSLAHIINRHGMFDMDSIENMGDAHEALHECFHIIRVMSAGDMTRISDACDILNYPDPFSGNDSRMMSKIGWKCEY